MSDYIDKRVDQLSSENKVIDALFNNELKRYPDFMNKSKSPWTTKVLWNYVIRFDELFKGIAALSKNSNLYSIKILYRSFIEHWLTEYYLIDISIKKKTDIVSEQFAKHNFVSEYLKFEKAHAEIEAIKKKDKSKVDFVGYISSKYEAMKEFDKSNQQEISKAIEQFSIKNIILYFYKFWDARGDLEFDGSFFLKFIPEYSQLSSFTHGGPYASKLMEVYEQEKKIDEELDKILTISLLGSINIKENFILHLMEDDHKEYLEFYSKTSSIRNLAVDHFKKLESPQQS